MFRAVCFGFGNRVHLSVFSFAIWFLLHGRVEPLHAEWLKLTPATKLSPRRSGHAWFGGAGEHQHNHHHYIFGGYVEEDSNDGMKRRHVTNDMWMWSGDSWDTVDEKGDVPRPRLVAASAIVKDKAYLFGGWDPGTEGTGGDILDSIHELDLPSHTWKEIGKLPDGPASRHVAVTLDDDRVLLHNHRCEGHIWVFDPATHKMVQQVTSGPSPSSRGLHAVTRLSESRVLLFGGAAKDGKMSNEAYLLDTNKWEWSPILVDPDKCPSPRAAPCLCTYDARTAILFGGAEATTTGLVPKGDVWALHIDEGKWELLLDESSDIHPPPRNAASLAFVEAADDHKSFLLTGGWHPFVQTWDDCFLLDVSND